MGIGVGIGVGISIRRKDRKEGIKEKNQDGKN